jgi:alpha-galactosidase
MLAHQPANKTSHSIPTTDPQDMAKSRAWAQAFFSTATDLPISFVYGENAIHGIPSEWKPVTHRRRIDANISETVFEGMDAQTGLQVRVESQAYYDYPVVEWVAWFTNTGDTPTPVLRDIRIMDGAIKGQSPVLYHCNGDYYSADGYKPEETPVTAGSSFSYTPNGGRSCDGAFPYYRIGFGDWGITLAIGWPAQWAVRFTGQADGVQIQAGQEKTNLRLMPGETIRTPRMTILTWTGDRSKAVNLWRRWYLAHVLPRPDGQPMKPLLACAATDEGDEFTAATEENQVRFIEKFNQHGIYPDVWWIDAGWYPCYDPNHERKWWFTGTWEPDPERFPRGLKPVSERAARSGADLLVWFEPERVAPGRKIEAEHPEWLLRSKVGEGWSLRDSLLYLGNPQCRQWLTDHVCKLIQDNGIKIYRQDHNFPPLEHWRLNEADDRQGMNENLHVQGYLKFWDDLLARNPGLWIDSCASGGRRNDLETMRRSVPLHYTDYGYGDHPIKLSFHHTLYEWIPYFKECTLSYDIGGPARFDHQIDSFSYHCGMAPMLFATLDIRRDDYDYPLAVKMIDLWRKASDLILYGDYYQHTPFHRSSEQWVAWQFDSPENGQGLLQGIRLPASPQETLTIHPKVHSDKDHPGPDTTYYFENPETGETRQISADVLIRDGFTFDQPARSGSIWFYRMLAP